MAVAFAIVVHRLPPELSIGRAFDVAGVLGRMKIVDLSSRPGARYTLWSGLLGGLFVGLAYFGTDQSQVQRYLSSSVRASRLGLLFNGLVKVPMQFLILSVGIMVFVFAQAQPPSGVPRDQLEALASGPHAADAQAIAVETAAAQAE